jgi:hypothetical protein
VSVLELDGRRIARLLVGPPPEPEETADVESGTTAG